MAAQVEVAAPTFQWHSNCGAVRTCVSRSLISHSGAVQYSHSNLAIVFASHIPTYFFPSKCKRRQLYAYSPHRS